jgi:hypothetical protein
MEKKRIILSWPLLSEEEIKTCHIKFNQEPTLITHHPPFPLSELSRMVEGATKDKSKNPMRELRIR